MKILWFSHLIPYPPKAGVLLRSYNLVREVARYHELDLLAFNQEPLLGTFFDDVEQGVNEARQELSQYCGNVEFLPIESDEKPFGRARLAAKSLMTRDCFTINWLKSPLARNTLARMVADTPYDVVHFDTISLAPYREILPECATVLDHHNIESHMMRRRATRERNPVKRAYFSQEGKRLQSYEQRVCRDFDLNITCSALDSERLRQLDPSLSIVEVPNGVDPEFFRPAGLAQKPFSLVFVGTMNWYPNVDAVKFLLDEVWPQLIKLQPEVTLDIVGAHPPDELLQRAAMLPGVTVHGYVDDVRPYIERASVYVCPIRDGGGTKLKLLDAFAMEKAVLCHPVACEGIEATPDSDVVFAESADDFCHQIIALFGDDGRRLALGQAARKLVIARYSFASIGRSLADLYTGLGSTRTAGPEA